MRRLLPPAARAGRRTARQVASGVLALSVLTTLAGCVTLAPRSRPVSETAIVFERVPVRQFGPERCGAGSLSAVLGQLGASFTVEEMDARLPRAPGGGVLSVDLLLAARELGYEARWVKGSAERLRQAVSGGRPVILMLRVLNAPGYRVDYYHYVVVDGIDPQRGLLRFQFGDGKARWSRLGRGLRRAWRGGGHAMLLIGPPRDADATRVASLRRAVDLESEGHLQEAARAYHEILATHPESSRVWTNLGNVRTRLGDREGAEDAYQRAIDIDPEQADALNNFAWLLLERGERLAEAERLARLAADREGPDRDLALDTLGRVLLANGRCGEAASTFRRALGLTPGDRPVDRVGLLEGLARAHTQCGDLRGAFTLLERALDAGPDPSTADSIRSDLASLRERTLGDPP